jgi:hypothetical protein
VDKAHNAIAGGFLLCSCKVDFVGVVDAERSMGCFPYAEDILP